MSDAVKPNQGSSKWRLGAQWLLLVVAVVLYGWLACYRPWLAKHDNDFKHMYLGASALLAGQEPYTYQSLRNQAEQAELGDTPLNPFVYLPFTGYVMGPLTMVSLASASDMWFCLNHGLLILTLIMLASLFWRRQFVLVLAIMIIAVAPNATLHRTLTAGQLNIALLFMLTVGFVQLMKGRQGLVGAILGFAALFKLFPAIFATGLWLVNQRRASVFMGITAGILLSLTLLLPNSLTHHQQFAAVLEQMSYGRSTWQQHGAQFWKDPTNQSLNSFLTHVMVGGQGITPWVRETQTTANQVTVAVTVLLVLGWVAAAARHWHSSASFKSSVGKQAVYQLTLVTGLLLPSLLWDHYLVMLVLPVTVLMWQSITLRRKWAVAGLAAIYTASALPIPFGVPAFSAGGGLVLMSFKLFPVLFLYGLSLCFSLSKREIYPT